MSHCYGRFAGKLDLARKGEGRLMSTETLAPPAAHDNVARDDEEIVCVPLSR